MNRKVEIAKITCEDDRKNGGQGDIGILAESIRDIGLLQPVILRDSGDGAFTLVAGRRRLAAVKKLNWTEIPANVYGPELPDTDMREMALTENVNRLDLHPLDEAEKFQALLDSGRSITDIAGYYSRSVAGIYQRTRLLGLEENLKKMFREDKIGLTHAAMLADLDPDQQERFWQENKSRTGCVNRWEIDNFIHKVQKNILNKNMTDKKCASCAKRTNYSDGTLFPELEGASDVCLDGECYAAHWIKIFERILKTKKKEFPGTQNILEINNISKFWDRNGVISILGEDYKVRSFSWQNTASPKDRGAFFAWKISLYDKKLEVTRECYKEAEKKQPEEKADSFGAGFLLPGRTEREIRETEQKIESKKIDVMDLKRKVILKTGTAKRKLLNTSFTDDFIAQKFSELINMADSKSNRVEIKLYRIYTGEEPEKTFRGAKKLLASNPEKFFQLLFFTGTDVWEIPSPDTLKACGNKDRLHFFKDIDITLEEIHGIYRESLEELIK
jgi:ParB/RepB/Spo0J family partition protein